MQGWVISCGTVVFFQKSRNLSRSLLTNNNFYCDPALCLTEAVPALKRVWTLSIFIVVESLEIKLSGYKQEFSGY